MTDETLNAASEIDETLNDKVNAVAEELADLPSFPPSKSAAAEIGEDPANFNHILAGRRKTSPQKLTETLTKLHRALRLEILGIKFSFEWWTQKSTRDMRDEIRAARALDLLETLDGRLTTAPFFDLPSILPKARIVINHGASPVWANIANKPVSAHDQLTLRATPPMDGFMKLLVIESGLVVSMDAYFGLTHKRFRAGEGVMSLSHAFRLAGVRNVIMTYWTIPDAETQAFMTDFYTAWLNKPQDGPGAALRATKQAWMRGPHANPFYWAGFGLIENAPLE